jgi:hypothetical protein
MPKAGLTIVIPWLSRSDWTSLIFFSLKKEANRKKIKFNLIVGERINEKKKVQKKEPFSFLYPKLKVVEKIIEFSHKNILADNIVIIDSSFVNMKVIRYIAGDNKKISCFVNGGFFQNHDLDRQTISGYREELSKFEEGHYSLMDKIFLPSKYALDIFLKKYPSLKNKCFYNYYELEDNFNKKVNFSNKNNYLFASRQSFEKGADIISQLVKDGLKIDSVLGLENKLFRKKLSTYKALLVPSRADLFGFCALESVFAGTIPIVPDGFGYKELINIPDNLKLSVPLTNKTKKEREKILKIIDKMPESEYDHIINQAKRHLLKKITSSEHGFLSAVEKIFYE